MAEIAGIIIGAVGLVALESTVEEFFEKVTIWKAHGKDYEHYRLKLDMARIAYQRWAKSVKITDSVDNNVANLPVANPEETKTVKDLLGAIAATFQEAEKTSGQFESKEPDAQAAGSASTNDVVAAYRAAVEKRQKGTAAWMKLRWVVHDKKVLASLTERVEQYVDGLTRLFPGAVEQAQKMFATVELEDHVPTDSAHERERLGEVVTKSEKVDQIMQQVAVEAIARVDSRHQYHRSEVRDGARAVFGDSYGEGAKLQLDGPGPRVGRKSHRRPAGLACQLPTICMAITNK